MLSPFPIVDVTMWPVASLEPGGNDEKVWLTAADNARWLFKPAVVRDGRRQGEDWAEKASSELAGLISVPAARTEMAVRSSAPGSISRNLVSDPGTELQSGAILIGEVEPNFVAHDKSRKGHNLANIARVLREVGPPPEFDGPAGFSAFDVFCGYALFDAWIANRDRHEENWSVLRTADGSVALAASYDHGSSLAFQLTDDRRRHVLDAASDDTSDIEQWVEKGTAHRYEGGRAFTLVEFAQRALSMAPGCQRLLA